LATRSERVSQNVRKQGIEQIENAKKFGVQGLVKDLIYVFDTLELALANVKG
jgi:molecular chaperone GrpE (heat shock protein)